MSATVTLEAPSELRTAEALIALERVEKVYRMGKVDYRALRGVDLSIGTGEMVAVVGPSGSGKTTILNLITGIDRPTSGAVTVDGKRLDEMSEEQLAVWRGANVGIVFQFFQLLPTLSALENAVLPLDFARRGSKRERFERARHNLELVGLGDKLDHLPAELSGGEQQRVAIARSLAADPKLIVGDEPTGNLDSVTADEMFELLQRLNGEGKTILFVTHDRELAARAQRVVDDPRRRRRRGLRRRRWSPHRCASRSRDLSRRRARTVFTVATLALAVASISFFAIPTLIDRVDAGGSARRKARGRDRDDAAALAHGRAARGARGAPERGGDRARDPRQRARARGRAACARARDRRPQLRTPGRRRRASRLGRLPGPGEVLTEVQNANVGVYDGRAGDIARVVGAGGLPDQRRGAQHPGRRGGPRRAT